MTCGSKRCVQSASTDASLIMPSGAIINVPVIGNSQALSPLYWGRLAEVLR